MAQLEGYDHFGGRHWETANLRNVLAHAGLRTPHTGEPLSEAMVLGIAGGIGAGYSFCPSVVRYGMGSGIGILGRHQQFATGPELAVGLVERLGGKLIVHETAGKRAALGHVTAALEAGRAPIVYVSKTFLPYLALDRGAAACDWAHTAVVHAIDAERGEAQLGDAAPAALTIGLDDLATARAHVCSYKNRTIVIEPPRKLSAAKLKAAVEEGIRACVRAFRRPRIKTFGFDGLLEWSKMIANDKHAKGWRRVFPKGLVGLALRDAFDSIETSGTGGGLYRPFYAEFLDEAAAVTKRKGLASVADRYRELGARWTAFAEALLPSRIGPFKKSKAALRRREKAFLGRGARGRAAITKASDEIDELGRQMRAKAPLDDAATVDLLESLRAQLVELHAAELAALDELEAATR